MARKSSRATNLAASDERTAREHLLDAAGAEMIAAETADVSLHAIARRAGLTAPLVTYYFKSKEGLLMALAERDMGPPMQQLEGLLKMPISAEEMFRIHISGIIRNYARRPYLNSLLSLLLRDESSPTAIYMRDTFVNPLVAIHREIIELGVAEGRFRPVDPRFAYFTIVGACQYFFTNKVTVKAVLGALPDDEQVNLYAKSVVDWLLNGVRKG